MLSTLIATVLSFSVYGTAAAGAGLSDHAQITAEQYALIEKINAKCQPQRVPTLQEKLTASTAPLLRFQGCISKGITASPKLAGWHAVPTQVSSARKK